MRERNLYENQEYEDNYINETFLDRLVVKDIYRDMNYWQMSLKSVKIVMELNKLAAFLILFKLLSNDNNK